VIILVYSWNVCDTWQGEMWVSVGQFGLECVII